MQSIASRLAAFFLCARMVYSPPMEGRLAPLVDKGINSGFSCLAVFVVCHDSDVLSFLKKCDAYPNGDFNKDDRPT